jgi:hypothetical protein
LVVGLAVAGLKVARGIQRNWESREKDWWRVWKYYQGGWWRGWTLRLIDVGRGEDAEETERSPLLREA